MISGLDLNATQDYVLKNDTNNPTVWKLGVIPSYLFARISADAGTKQIETTYKILQLTIRGWDNFNVPFSTVKEKIYGEEISVVPLSLLSQLSIPIITELSQKAIEINQLTEIERKN